MDYEIKIKINNIDINELSLLNDIIEDHLIGYNYSIASKEIKPIVKKVKDINIEYIKLALYLNEKDNVKYNIDKQWNDKKINSTADQFRLLIEHDKEQYNKHDLTIDDCYDLIDFALKKDKLFIIRSGESFRKKVESIIANKFNENNGYKKKDNDNNCFYMQPNINIKSSKGDFDNNDINDNEYE